MARLGSSLRVDPRPTDRSFRSVGWKRSGRRFLGRLLCIAAGGVLEVVGLGYSRDGGAWAWGLGADRVNCRK